MCGSLYRPEKIKGKIPVVLNPDGHFARGRYRPDCQIRCAALARMGAMAFSYDLFGWDGESQLQVQPQDHRRALVQTLHSLNGLRILDYLLSLAEVDPARVAITGASGGGSHTMLMTAIDDRIRLSVPVGDAVGLPQRWLSLRKRDGCTALRRWYQQRRDRCHGRPASAAGGFRRGDWTQHVPETEFPFLQKIYSYEGKPDLVKNVHLASEGHDYGPSKRKAMYAFIAKQFGLNLGAVQNKAGGIDESAITVESEPALYVFGEKGERLPANAVKGFNQVTKVFEAAVGKK